MTDEIHVGDIGTIIEVTVLETAVALDISTATVKQFTLRKPDGTSVTKTALFSATGTDGKLRYTTILNDLDQSGNWTLQVYLEMPGGKWHSDKVNFTVWGN